MFFTNTLAEWRTKYYIPYMLFSEYYPEYFTSTIFKLDASTKLDYRRFVKRYFSRRTCEVFSDCFTDWAAVVIVAEH
jgi:capsule polysaccharide modification protein KpsS